MNKTNKETWDEVVEKEVEKEFPSKVVRKSCSPFLTEDLYIVPASQSGFKAGIKFAEANARLIPCVAELIELVKDYDAHLGRLEKEQGFYSSIRIDIEEALKALEGEK